VKKGNTMANRHRKARRLPQYPAQPIPVQNYYAPPQVPVPFAAFPTAAVQTLSAKNATVAKVVVSKTTDYTRGPDYQFEAGDSAKREQGDVYDPQTGELLAMGRAFQKLGRAMTSEGNKRVQASVAEQAALRARREQPKQPVHRRTREEWEALQRISQQAKNELLARNLGMEAGAEAGNVSSVAYAPRPDGTERVELAKGRYLVIEDKHVILHRSSGEVIMRIDRA
jgi:hypothetical protein